MRATGFAIDGASIASQRGSVTAATGVSFEMAACSDTGLRREHNEDAVFIDAAQGLAFVADGIGGHSAGEIASAMAVTCLSAGLREDLVNLSRRRLDRDGEERCLRGRMAERIAEANEAILMAARRTPQYAGMGTTLAAAAFLGDRLIVAHLGDSRLYRLRGAALSLLTRDHSLLQDQIDHGLLMPEAARTARHRHVITRALGVDAGVQAEIATHGVVSGDVYLLCSDGLNDMVPDEEIRQILQALPVNLELAAKQLIRMANDNGGRDNVSVILVKVLRAFPAARNWQTTFSAWFK